MNNFLEITTKGAIGHILLNQPERRNPLSLGMMEALCVAFERFASQNEVKAIVLSARGSVFCAGHDLKEMTAARAEADEGADFFEKTFTLCSRLMMRIVHQPQPVIAAIEGMATAAGCQLVASADLAIASERAQFCTPGVNIGLFCSTPMVALSRNVGRKAAMEMLLLGKPISAAKAEHIGLINRTVGIGEAEAEAFSWAEAIASKGSRTVKQGKAAFYSQVELDLASAYKLTAEVMTNNMLDNEAKQGIAAFFDRTKKPS